MTEKWTPERVRKLLDAPRSDIDREAADDVRDMFIQAVLTAGWTDDRVAIDNLLGELEDFAFDELLHDSGGKWDDGIIVNRYTGAPLVPDRLSAIETMSEPGPVSSPYQDLHGGHLEDMDNEPRKVGSTDVARAARWEIKRMLAEDPRGHAESQYACAERLRPGLRETLIGRGVIKSSDTYPALDRLRKMIAAVEDGE